MIRVSICLSDLPKDKITMGKSNNKKYINLVIDEKKEIDKFGNSHAVTISQSKEEREAKTAKVYVGNGKEYKFNNNAATPNKEYNNIPSPENVDDLPF